MKEKEELHRQTIHFNIVDERGSFIDYIRVKVSIFDAIEDKKPAHEQNPKS